LAGVLAQAIHLNDGGKATLPHSFDDLSQHSSSSSSNIDSSSNSNNSNNKIKDSTMVTLPFPSLASSQGSKRIKASLRSRSTNKQGGHRHRPSNDNDNDNDESFETTELFGNSIGRIIIGKPKHRHRGAIQLVDSEEMMEFGGSSIINSKEGRSEAGTTLLSDAAEANETVGGQERKAKLAGGAAAGGRGLLKFGGGGGGSSSRRKVNTSFQRLDAASSSGSSSSVSFDVRNNNNNSNINSTAAAAQGDKILAASVASAPPLKDVSPPTQPGGISSAAASASKGVGSKFKLRIKGTKTFQKLDNVEGSHDRCAYEPPSDYQSLAGAGNDAAALGRATLQLLNIASQSHFAQQQKALQYTPFDRRDADDGDEEGDDEEGRQAAAMTAPAKPRAGAGDDHDDAAEEREDVEFRQFVFDKNFSTIEAVNVEKSDSGTGNDDIFRMAAVETVTRMSLAQNNQKSPARSASSPKPKSSSAAEAAKPSCFSPARRPVTAGPKPFSPASGLLPKSPNHSRSLWASSTSGGRDSATQTTPKLGSPGAVSRGTSLSASTGKGKAASPSSFDDFSKQRFQALVKRNGKLSVQSPLSASSHTHQLHRPDRVGSPFGASTGNRAALGAKLTTSSVSTSNTNPKQHSAPSGGTTAPPMSRSLAKNDATNFELPLSEPSQNAHEPAASPLGTRRHFGNAAGRRAARAASPNRSKSRAAAGSHPISSMVSTASNANATVSTGPDENRRMEAKWSSTRPEAIGFDDDDDNPFRIGQVDPWKDSAAWDVERVSFPARRRQEEATAKTSTGSTSSASRGDTSLLIQSIRSAVHHKTRATRHREAQVHRPDPPPRGVPHSSSDSFLDFAPAKAGGRSGKGQMGDHDDIVTSKSDGAMEADQRTLGSAPFVAASPVTLAQIGNGRKTSSKAPSGVPEHAILASMLFRQTEVFQLNDEIEASGTEGQSQPSKPSGSFQRRHVPLAEAAPHVRFDVPSAVHTSSAASIVSSVTEEASIFYNKNLQPSSYKSQAHTALNNYHNLRSKPVQQQHPHPHQQRTKYPAPSIGSAVQQAQRSLQQQQQQQQQQPPPPRKWVSSSSSRKTTASSTGRPTWLDRVEEEHMRMFS
jgi:hypothetical protein